MSSNSASAQLATQRATAPQPSAEVIQAALVEFKERFSALEKYVAVLESGAERAKQEVAKANLEPKVKMALGAGLATALAPAEAVLHDMLANYHGETTPLAAAERVHKHIEDALARGSSYEDTIAKLASDIDLLTLVATAASTKAVPTMYSLDGGELTAQVNPGAANPWQLLATAADSLTTHYLQAPSAMRARVAPGVFACKSYGLARPKPDQDGVVYLLANSNIADPAYRAGLACLKQPHYTAVIRAEGVPNGMPIGTARKCNSDVPGAKTLKVLSTTDGKEKDRTVILDFPASCWEYTFEGKSAMLGHIYQAIAAAKAALGDAQSESIAAARHQVMQARSLSDASIQMLGARLSNHG